jgi:Tol biopolymer transport system component
MTRLPPPPPGRVAPYPGTRPPGVLYPPVQAPGRGTLAPRRQQPRRRTPFIAPVLSLLGLLLIGGASIWAMGPLGIDITALGGAAAEPSQPIIAAATVEPASVPDPSAAAVVPDVVEPEPTDLPDIVEPPPNQRADVRGSIVFSRSGDIWIASGQQLRQLTDADSSKTDSSPTWSPNGKQIYFIRTTKRAQAKAREGGGYTLYVTDLMRMNAAGGKVRKVHDSLIRAPAGTWFSYVLQPDVSPDGSTVAVVSDGSDGSGPVELHLVNARSGRMSKVAAPAEGDLGHNDPAFSPDGRKLAFTYNHAQATDGVPRIGILNCRSRRNCDRGRTRLLRLGYAHPSWSPNGRWIAAEATRGNGRDIVILDPARGDVRVTLTHDGDSFAPVVSPAGDQIAYLHRDGVDIDVRVMDLDFGDDGSITLVSDRPVTQDGNIDGESPPNWFIPAAELETAPTGEPTDLASTGDVAAAAADAPPAEAEGAPAPPG